jgi:DNA-binding protein YbaB
MTEPPEPSGPLPDSIEQRLAQAMAELEATEAAVARAEKQLRHSAMTTLSRDGSVEVTVGPQGELTGLKFLDGKYRSMSAPQLAAAVLDAATEGRQRMARQVMEMLEPLTRPSRVVPELAGTEIDWTKMFGALGPAPADVPGARPVRDRLRDEIHDDEAGRHD